MLNLEIRKQYNSKINVIYNVYKTMVKEPKLPLPPIEYVNNVDYNARVQFLKWDAKKLQVNTKLILNHPEQFEEIMYHEFTHIFDLYTAHTKDMYNDFTKDALMLYTEFHATQIECLNKFKLLNSYGEKIVLSISNQNLCQGIIKFCMDQLQLYIDKRKHFQYIRNKERAEAIKTSYMYYLGSSVYLENLLGNCAHPIGFIDSNSKSDLSQIYNILKDLDYYQFPTLEQLVKINIISKFIDARLKTMFNC